jgi:hypothetical protein
MQIASSSLITQPWTRLQWIGEYGVGEWLIWDKLTSECECMPLTRSSMMHTRTSMLHTRTSMPLTRISMPHTRTSMPHTRTSMLHTRRSMPHTRTSMPHTRSSSSSSVYSVSENIFIVNTSAFALEANGLFCTCYNWQGIPVVSYMCHPGCVSTTPLLVSWIRWCLPSWLPVPPPCVTQVSVLTSVLKGGQLI